jgi:hypothetical protein
VLINLPIVAATFVAIWRFAPESRDENKTPLDPVGALLSLVGLSALVYSIIQGGEHGFTSPAVITAGFVAVATIALFLMWELRSEHPMLPMRFFRDVRFSRGSAVITIAFFVMLGFFFLATQYLQFARGYSPLLAGVALLPLPIVFVILSPASASLSARFSSASVIAVGLAIVAAGFGILTQLTSHTSYLVLAIAFAVLGAGMSMTAAPATGEIMSAVPMSKAGVGSAVNDTTRELGGALGIAILGSVANSAYRSSINLSGLGLAAAARATGEDSIGGAAGITSPVRAVVHARAAASFTDAFAVASAVSVAIALAAAVGVLVLSRRAGTSSQEAIVDDLDLELLAAS